MTVTKVWAVTDGEYSDFRVVALFETETDADAARKRGMGDDVMEMDFYAAGVKPQKAKWVRLVAQLDVETAAIWNLRTVLEKPEDIRPFTNEVWRHPGRARVTTSVGKRWVPFVSASRWQVEVDGPDNERTRKVFYDLVAKTRAEIVEGHR